MAEKDWSSELTAYIDGELAEAEVHALEAQLARDPQLRALERRLRATVARVEALPRDEHVPASLRRGVLAAVERPTPWERLKGFLAGPGLLVPAAVAATAAVVLWPAADEDPDTLSGEQLALAQNMELMEDLDVLGAESPEDLDVIATRHELEIQR